LWFTNAVTLSGHYDWFYEGFALYQSLKTGVKLNRIRFDDMLDTLSRAYTIDSALTNRRSLIDSSSNRATGGDTDLYARGMIIAFVTDLELMSLSDGKKDVGWLLRNLYERYRDPKVVEEGNRAILQLIGSPRVTRYVEGNETIDLAEDLRAAGIELATQNSATTLRVTQKPSRRQRQLLDKLGYNMWRESKVSP
jgi:predicted metalloprotease with PDZ domain